jgi:hypothetical protein
MQLQRAPVQFVIMQSGWQSDTLHSGCPTVSHACALWRCHVAHCISLHACVRKVESATTATATAIVVLLLLTTTIEQTWYAQDIVCAKESSIVCAKAGSCNVCAMERSFVGGGPHTSTIAPCACMRSSMIFLVVEGTITCLDACMLIPPCCTSKDVSKCALISDIH